MAHPKKGTRKFSDLYVRPLQKSAKVASITCNESYSKGATCVDSKMTTDFKKRSIVETIVVSLKVKEIYSHIAQGQENVTLLGYCWLTYFK